MIDTMNPPAVVQRAEETEAQLVAACRELIAKIDDCKWELGRMAHEWTQRHANGRTDADFGKLIGLPQQQVNARRLVWATFGDVYHSSGNLSWTHFREVLNWDDSEEWLAEANQNEWSVATMKRMRDVRLRIDNNEDLSEPNEHFGDPEQLAEDDEPDDVQDVDLYQRPPSTVKHTPPDFADDPDPKDSVGPVPTGQNNPSPTPAHTPAATTPAEPAASVTVDNAINNIAALVTALKPQLKGQSGHTLAAQLRRWADEIDPPKRKKKADDGPAIPASLDTTAGRQAWDEWREYRRQTRKKLTPIGETKLLSEWAERGATRFVAAVNHSITNGWQGLFEPEGKHGNATHARAISEGRAVGDNYQPEGVF